jgi:hypothetical protein
LRRTRARRRTTTCVGIRVGAAWTHAVGARGRKGRDYCARGAHGADPEDVDTDDNGAVFQVGNRVADGIAGGVGFAAFDEETSDEGGAELIGRVGVSAGWRQRRHFATCSCEDGRPAPATPLP